VRHGTHTNESRHAYIRVMSQVATKVPTIYKFTIYKWVTEFKSMNLVTHMNESWHTYEWVMSQVATKTPRVYMNLQYIVMAYKWVSHVTGGNTNFSLWIRNISVSHGTHMNESCHRWRQKLLESIWICNILSWHANEWVMSQVATQISRVYESAIYQWVMAHIWMSHVTGGDKNS